jgi:hypothetical protein
MTSSVVVNPLLPECLDGALTQEDVNPEAALAFRPNDYSYYKGVLTSIVPGLVLGCLAAVALIIVAVWVRYFLYFGCVYVLLHFRLRCTVDWFCIALFECYADQCCFLSLLLP